MTLLVFLVFGGAFLPAVLREIEPSMVLYALLSLTVIRAVPVALSLWGLRLRPMTVLFLGWFGPRGIASILYALLVVEAVAPGLTEVVMPIVMLTVALSILLHGVTAYPAVVLYERYLGRAGDAKDSPEHASVAEMPVRVGHAGG